MMFNKNEISRVLVTEEEIKGICKKLGDEISKDYADKSPLIIGVLKGSFIFMADLLRNIDCDHKIDFMAVSSYSGAKTTGQLKIKKDLDVSVEGRDILILEDILDTGITLEKLKNLLIERKANSVKICTFLDKAANRIGRVEADYIGKVIPDEFVVGYGLDYNEKYRNLPFVGILSPQVYSD